MLRDYNNGIKDDVRMFAGKEVEHTPAYGLQTLFLARNDLTYCLLYTSDAADE